MSGCQDRPLPESNGLLLAGTDEPASTDDPKATQHAMVLNLQLGGSCRNSRRAEMRRAFNSGGIGSHGN